MGRESRRPPAGGWDVVLAVSAGGALGSLARYAGVLLVPPAPGAFPWATFVENVSGGFLLGALVVWLLEVLRPSRLLRPFLGVGLLGGYTTFSAYMLDARALLAAGEHATAALYVGGTLLAGLVAVWCGVAAGRLGVLAVRRAARGEPGSPGRGGGPTGDGAPPPGASTPMPTRRSS